MKYNYCLLIAAPLLAAAILIGSLLGGPARAQMMPGQSLAAIGYCQIPAASTTSAVDLSACVAASFTATCAGTTITASSVTGSIGVGWKPTGTGITAGTTIVSQLTGTANGAGTYQASASCTSSAASLTTVGPPVNANTVLLQATTQNLRWRDDGANPTTTVGQVLIAGQNPAIYSSKISGLKFINGTAGAILDASFYRSSSP